MRSISRLSFPGAAVVLLATLAVSACATPQNRLRTGLMDAGLSDRSATCMADYMMDRVSLVQLRRLESLTSLKKVNYDRISIADYLYRVRALQDPELIAITGKAALYCAF